MATETTPGTAVSLLKSGPKGPFELNDVAVLLSKEDTVAIAKQPLMPGTILRLGDGSEVRVAQMIPPGHKVALRDVAEGDPIRRYGQIIGFATQPISIGQHVHTQNHVDRPP